MNADVSSSQEPSAKSERKRTRKQPHQKSIGKSLFYRFIRLTARILAVNFFEFRGLGRENTLFEGGALILSSHQSHFDPVLIGATFNEQLNFLARRTLFKNRLFGTVISLLDAIELDRDRSGLAGLKETIKRVRSGSKVLIFPEGTRTSDGHIARLKPGFLAVARRCKVPLIPIAITGAYEALPKGAKFPVRQPLRVSVGGRIDFAEFESLNDDDMLELVQTRLEECFQRAHRTLA